MPCSSRSPLSDSKLGRLDASAKGHDVAVADGIVAASVAEEVEEDSGAADFEAEVQQAVGSVVGLDDGRRRVPHLIEHTLVVWEIEALARFCFEVDGILKRDGCAQAGFVVPVVGDGDIFEVEVAVGLVERKWRRADDGEEGEEAHHTCGD